MTAMPATPAEVTLDVQGWECMKDQLPPWAREYRIHAIEAGARAATQLVEVQR